MGLVKLGHRPTPAEIDGYFELWRQLGVGLGLEPGSPPRDAREAARLVRALRARRVASCSAAKALAAAHCELVAEWLPPWLADASPDLLRLLLGELDADRLGLAGPTTALGRLGPLTRLGLRLELGGAVIRHVALHAIATCEREVAKLGIPPWLMAQWTHPNASAAATAPGDSKHVTRPIDAPGSTPMFWVSVFATFGFWLIAYVLIIKRSFADRCFGMPIAALCCNMAWELLLELRGFALTRTQRDQIAACDSLETLERWYTAAKTAQAGRPVDHLLDDSDPASPRDR